MIQNQLVLALFFVMAMLLSIDGACGAVSTAKIFSDHMVLQRDKPVEVWGKAEAGAAVIVQFAQQSIESKADQAGRWRITLKPMKANDVGSEMIIQGGTENRIIKDVLVGEVWFAGGQSNMAFTAGQMAARLPLGMAMVEGAQFPAVRLRRIGEGNSAQLKDDLDGGRWDVCSPTTAGNHSAVAFVFARRLHQELKVPVGIIDCSWGGTPIEPYIPAAAFTGHPTLEKLAALAKAGDMQAIKELHGGTFVRSPAWLAGAIYNSRVAPVAPYAIRGAIWYQGESNCGTGEDPRDYAHKMRALIAGWRDAWQQKELPFYFVQLPQWNSYAWTYLREEQLKATDVPSTGMAVTIDLDNANDIHPPNKIDVGERLARWPLAKVYARDVIVSGPLYREMSVVRGVVSVNFDHVQSGLMVGRQEEPGKIGEVKDGEINGFELCGNDGQWHLAYAKVLGKTISVTSGQVKQPVAVRYACHPQARKEAPWNLYSKAGLPASPFCSDWKWMVYDPAKNPMPK